MGHLRTTTGGLQKISFHIFLEHTLNYSPNLESKMDMGSGEKVLLQAFVETFVSHWKLLPMYPVGDISCQLPTHLLARGHCALFVYPGG